MTTMIRAILHRAPQPRRFAAPANPAVFGVDHDRIARAVREILIAVGEDPDREGLLDTPARVARAYAETFAGLREDAGTHLARTFEHEASGDDVVIRWMSSRGGRSSRSASPRRSPTRWSSISSRAAWPSSSRASTFACGCGAPGRPTPRW